MKKKMFVIILAAFLFLPSASPWEGAGAVAPSGELPQTGFFVATSSFPRNTVVDITNIETGRSTRAIVANTLNTPGLLAIVSREAAELIGMRAGSTSRIRMVQPSDPIAYLRFMESAASGNPGFDSGAVINEEELLRDVYSGDSYNPSLPSQAVTQAQTATVPAASPPIVPPGITGPSYIVEPEWGGSARMNIVDIPGFNVVSDTPVQPDNFAAVTPPVNGNLNGYPKDEYPVETAAANTYPLNNGNASAERQVVLTEQWNQQRDINKVVSPRYDERPPAELVKEVNEFMPERYAIEAEKDTSVFLAETSRDDVVKDVREFISEAPRSEVIKDITEREVYVAQEPQEIYVPQEIVENYIPQEPKAEPIPETPAPAVYNLVEAENRPPEGIYGINPNDIIPGIARATPQRQPETSAYIPPSSTVAPVSPSASVSPQVPITQPSQNFSVRTISALDRGQYYVQIAALPGEAVESAVRQIDRHYDPAILRDGSNLYRIVIGPLNQGESAAILARFKSIGYRDAFVRRGS